jgi:NAD(P)-dependent dehydrogenase (short-subunit alcohol dehydrogenase family)
MKSVVVTGASTGIGWGISKVLIKKGFRVFGSVRKDADAARLKTEFGANFVPVLFDVTDEGAVIRGAETVSGVLAGECLAGLVNNAGIAVPGPLLYVRTDDFRRQLEVNVTGQLIVTKAFAPLLGADPKRTGPHGRIVMITSVGGRNGSPFVGPYNASKFALEGLSEALRRELIMLGIDVIVVAPGAVATPIWDKADAIDVSQFENTPYFEQLKGMQRYMLELGRKGFKPERIGKTVWQALTLAKPRVHYTVTPSPIENMMVNLLPKRMVDRIVAGRLGLLPKK